MISYKAPLREMRFVFAELHGGIPCYQEFSQDIVDSILDGAPKLSETVLQPLNRAGDEQGCSLADGVVRTPIGFPDAYRAYAGGGWASLSCDPHYSGQGAPHALRVLVDEMICSANLGFASYTTLITGAYRALHAHASTRIKDTYLPKIVAGEWAATMCLTEAHCGSDLGLIRTKAVPQEDGSYRIRGTKTFISAGDHDQIGRASCRER